MDTNGNPMRRIDEIILHCPATKEGQDIKAATIRKWHLQRGFKDIGYHYVIDLDGKIEVGRPDSQVGAHTSGRNSHSIGICYVGGLDKKGKPKDTRTDAQRYSMLNLVIALILMYGTVSKVTGHRQYANQACPSFDVPAWLEEIGLGRFALKDTK